MLSVRASIAGVVYRASQGHRRLAFAVEGFYAWLLARPVGKLGSPRITMVVVGRNDDYMPDFIGRLSATVAWNLHFLATDVVFVEWNPPADRPLLAPVLAARFPELQAYVIAPALHAALCKNPAVPLLEFHAKNVGLRRAQGEWLCATNADAAFGLDSVRRVLGRAVPPSIVWTAQRIDIEWRAGRTRPLGIIDSIGYRRIVPYTPYGSGEFVLAHRSMWHDIRGYDESQDRHRMGCDTRGVAQMMSHGATVRRAGKVLHLAHPTSCTEGIQPHHGDWAPMDGLPYHNTEDWGFSRLRSARIAERVYRLE